MSTPQTSTYATGKRKTAVARVWVKPGSGQFQVNGVPGDNYFERETSRMIMRQSLELIEVLDHSTVTAAPAGGEPRAKADAMRHGIARALIAIDPERRGSLKKAGF